MANRAPYRGRLPLVSSTTGENKPEIDRANQNRALHDIEREFMRGKEHSDVGTRGESLRGDGNDQTLEVSFKKADFPLFISHDFGYTIRNWTVVDKCGKGDIYRPVGKKYTPNDRGIWLASSEDGCTCRIRLDGQEGNK
jgi:hypothetical protein